MPVIRTCFALALLAPLLGFAQAARAGELEIRPANLMLLEPASDGAYALPLASGTLMPLSFEPGETGFSLVSVEFDPHPATLWVTFRYLGETPASALSVRVQSFPGEGKRGPASLWTEDWSPAADEGASLRFRATGLAPQDHEEGLLFPGQIHRVELGVSIPAEGVPPGRVVVSVPLLVYEDTSFTGSTRLAREVLGAREVAAEELAYWSVRMEEAVAKAGSEEEARTAVVRLLRELEAEAETLPHAAQAVRAGLRYNLEPLVGPRPQGNPRTRLQALRSLSDHLRLELGQRAKHVPRELPEAPAHGEDGARLRERFHDGTGGHGDTGGDEDMSCECGGSMFVSSSQSQTRNCNATANGWRVNETWTKSCRDDEGSVIHSESRNLNGFGGCVEGSICYDDTYCPPVFNAITETEDFYNHIWNRTVTNYHLAVGLFCTARCVVAGSESLTLQCPCEPPRRPGCNIDGCPVLIETGAGGYRLTDLEGGVHFDLDGDGDIEHVSWTAANGDDAWLALDRNGNGAIDDGTELFGDATEQPFSQEPNGFEALAVFDRPEAGGDGDGQITAADAVFGDLLLWLDRDQDGVSSAAELTGLAAAGVVALELDYHASHRRDRHGNQFRYFTRVWYASGARRLATDVFLLLE